MSTQIIEIEAESLEEVRKQLSSQIPIGYEVISERIVSDGKIKTLTVSDETVKEAFKKAQLIIPTDAEVIDKKELNVPEQKIITVEAFDEQSARKEADKHIVNSGRIITIRLCVPGKKGFLGIGKKQGKYEVTLFQMAVVEITYKLKAKIISKIGTGKEKKETIDFAANFAGGWPTELEGAVFDGLDFERLIDKLKEYQTMKHPGFPGEVPPRYEMVNGTIARIGDLGEDFKIATTAYCLQGRAKVNLFDRRNAQYAFEVIQRYAGTKLAKMLFTLPRAYEMVCSGEKNIIVIEDYMMDVYKGTENVLFEIYESLHEGQTFTDRTVTNKFISIITDIRL